MNANAPNAPAAAPANHVVHHLRPVGREATRILTAAIEVSTLFNDMASRVTAIITNGPIPNTPPPALTSLPTPPGGWSRGHYKHADGVIRLVSSLAKAQWQAIDGHKVLAIVPAVGRLSTVRTAILRHRLEFILRRATGIPTLQVRVDNQAEGFPHVPRVALITNVSFGEGTYIAIKRAFSTVEGTVLTEPADAPGSTFIFGLLFNHNANPNAVRIHVGTIWFRHGTDMALQELAELDTQLATDTEDTVIDNFVWTVDAVRTNMTTANGKTIFNIYTKKVFAFPRYWASFLGVLEGFDYSHPTLGEGTLAPRFACRVCASQDHPTEECTIPWL